MSILDFDLGSIFKKKESISGKPEEKTPIDKTVIIRAVIILVMCVAVFGVYFFLLKPVINSQENKIKEAVIWKQQIQSCKAEISNLETNIDTLKSESSLKGGLFVSDDEFENFYAELTEATIKSGLRIMDITRGEEIPVRLSPEVAAESSYFYTPISVSIPCEKGSKYLAMSNGSIQTEAVDPNCQGEECNPIAYYKMTVSYKIEGAFSNYLNFRNILAMKQKIVNIESEDIKKLENGNGRIVANATVSLVKNIR
tara:strand:+ start:3756 stop:4520 length:765 start_codon:yes stop_codon:yes gene_type:complete